MIFLTSHPRRILACLAIYKLTINSQILDADRSQVKERNEEDEKHEDPEPVPR
ncbi:hypothetical protein J007_03109 [Cryptococcus neoformans]|nr:hypothetical protein J007_03109 [Cryptococcus neoformans var. grubii]OXC61374.1 hypothetical protein C358_03194 [Cryptococcus neoformans var. grubii MW-RSA852]